MEIGEQTTTQSTILSTILLIEQTMHLAHHLLVVIQFDSFDLDLCLDCRYDLLEVRDGNCVALSLISNESEQKRTHREEITSQVRCSRVKINCHDQ